MHWQDPAPVPRQSFAATLVVETKTSKRMGSSLRMPLILDEKVFSAMTKIELRSNRITREAFFSSSAAMLAGVSALKRANEDTLRGVYDRTHKQHITRCVVANGEEKRAIDLHNKRLLWWLIRI